MGLKMTLVTSDIAGRTDIFRLAALLELYETNHLKLSQKDDQDRNACGNADKNRIAITL